MKKKENKRQLVFNTRITDEECQEWVKGGIALDLTDEEAVLMESIIRKYNDIAHKTLCADHENEVHESGMETPLHESRLWAFDLYVTDKNGEATCGVKGF